jgi:outer membrane receptor protein involved in Fe transport
MRRPIVQSLVALLLVASSAYAQQNLPTPSAAAKQAAAPEAAVDVDKEIDIANIVTSAAKGATTVQEAPAIITIITAEEIRQRGWRFMPQVLASIPGWIDDMAEGSQVVLPQVRGAVQAALVLRDGVSMFDPQFNVATLSRALPLETVKRVEVVTGPGGVLWGSNSFLGVINIITKDAEDVNGLEVSAGYGDGRGASSDIRAYAMFGKTFFKNRLKVFLHGSYENYQGMLETSRQFVASSPAPLPAGPALLSIGEVSNDFARSWILNLDGKITIFDKLNLYFNVPFAEMNYGITFNTTLITRDVDPRDPMHGTFANSDRSTWNFFDRYAVAEYRDRFFRDKLGLNAKAFYIQFNRDLGPRIFPASASLPGGLTFESRSMLIQRYGGTVDLDFSGPWSWNRVLAGGEAFHESSAQIGSVFPQPSDPNRMPPLGAGDLLPIVCPLGPDLKPIPQCPVTFAGGAERTVVGLFIDDQIRPPHTNLTLDGGVRYQQGFGLRGYKPQVLGSAAAVWQFYPDLHLKLNWSQGFRPPVFNNTDGNGAAVQFGGNPKLEVESSQSFSGEVNARLLRNVRKVRELQLRLDYAYTILDNLIVIRNDGLYQNSGRRAMHSVEFLGKLYLVGDHFLTLGYTFLAISQSDAGQVTASPRHWFTLGAVFNLLKHRHIDLDVNTNLNVFGAYNDPNRYISGAGPLPGTVVARFGDLTYDRLTPVALLQLGVRARFLKDHLVASAQFYNALNQRYYYPDPFFDQAPVVETRPNPAPGFSFFTSLTYRPY